VNGQQNIGRLHVITDMTHQRRFDHEELARMAVAGGADVVQVRDKLADPATLVGTVRRIRAICFPKGVVVIVNDYVAVARDANADGVHLGQDDAPVARSRRELGPGSIIGASAHNIDEAQEADEAEVDYIGFGHIFPTGSKEKRYPPVGTALLREVCRDVSAPVIAIGGIEEKRVDEVLDAGAWGIAVIGAVCNAQDPEAATRALRNRIDRWLVKKKRKK